MLFFILPEHIQTRNLLPLPAAPPTCPPEGLPWNPGLQVVPPVPKRGISHSQSSRESSTSLCYWSTFRSLSTRSPDPCLQKLHCCPQAISGCQCRILLHFRCNLWHQTQVWLWRRVLLTQNANWTLNHSPWAQQLHVLHARDQNHPKSPLCPKSSPGQQWNQKIPRSPCLVVPLKTFQLFKPAQAKIVQ